MPFKGDENENNHHDDMDCDDDNEHPLLVKGRGWGNRSSQNVGIAKKKRGGLTKRSFGACDIVYKSDRFPPKK